MLNDLLASIILFIGALYLYFFEIPDIRVMVPGSNSLLLARVILLIVLICSAIMGIKTLAKKDKKLKIGITINENKKKFLISVGITGLYVYLITILGYFILTPIFFFVFVFLLGYKNKVINFVLSLSLTFVIYLLFIKMLYIPLPQGIGIFKRFSEFILY